MTGRPSDLILVAAGAVALLVTSLQLAGVGVITDIDPGFFGKNSEERPVGFIEINLICIGVFFALKAVGAF